jgi:septum formation protein
MAKEREPRLILASESPQRKKLLEDAGYVLTTFPPGVDESTFPRNVLPAELAQTLSKAKAENVAPKFPDAVVLGADTVVAFGDLILGKPKDAADAARMIELLAGTTHIVITGVTVISTDANFYRSIRVMSAVRMMMLTSKEIERYVESGAWQGKAGGYGLQDKDPFVERVRGDRENIIGLPMKRTRQLLADAGVFPATPDAPNPSNSAAPPH